jgi:hypothetical protein
MQKASGCFLESGEDSPIYREVMRTALLQSSHFAATTTYLSVSKLFAE